MSSWSVFLQYTEELSQQVNQKVKDDNRDEVIQEVQRLLKKRAQMLEGLPQPADEEEKAIVKQIMYLDVDINQKLEFLFNGLKMEMRHMKRQKSSNKKYTNPYESVASYDGMFMDRKK
ncbi:flagellar protein FliT [Halobacillus sp. A5]|uniref:flagellar protein FliT n=1 Tax=Halobacillus sp. A5 TaxID=2880263 RepID=UPI0020A6A216|nr:flagellar protein FliT [Halobacillus sp. A5]MCP3028111.1 flagellar protein FliT [Halobacillus sp. A5]